MQQSEPLIVTTSWDDGHEHDVRIAGLLSEYHVKGTFYIAKDYLNHLSEENIKKISRDHEIGAHTLTHPTLTGISFEEAKKEISGSKIYLENLLNRPVTMFCYPRGKYNEGIKQLVKKSGFIAARTCKTGNFEFPPDPYEWQVSLHLSNGSPRMTLKMIVNHSLPLNTFFDWEFRAKSLFDVAVRTGGIFHIWGHSWEIEENREWEKLERVIAYIAGRKEVLYQTNSQVFTDHAQ